MEFKILICINTWYYPESKIVHFFKQVVGSDSTAEARSWLETGPRKYIFPASRVKSENNLTQTDNRFHASRAATL